MEQQRLYHDLAFLWPIISPPEEYAPEAWHLKDVLREKLGPGRHTLLELGTGGGHVLSHLAGEFPATAVDLSEKMLDLSMKLNPGVTHHVGDMRTVRLGQTFEAVLIHDAINYMLTEEDLRAALMTARAHLKAGGVLITAPDWFKETFRGPAVLHWTKGQGDREVTFIEYVHDPDSSDTTIESIYFYLINQGQGLRVEQDRHITGLFPKNTWLRLMTEAGFTATEAPYPVYEGGYGGNLIVGVLE